MLFTKLEFAFFLPVVFLVYWLVLKERLKAQNVFLLIASYVFYGWWDPRLLLLLFTVSIINYGIGLGLNMPDISRFRKSLLITGIVFNLGLLGFFKYFNFLLKASSISPHFLDFTSNTAV